jgi:hypothetical protein
MNQKLKQESGARFLKEYQIYQQSRQSLELQAQIDA